uniref:Uncharacterized protein n=1 Tax=Anguilla anguilla TaxID=7936 RepID=A0A0E9XQD6_ANGAN
MSNSNQKVKHGTIEICELGTIYLRFFLNFIEWYRAYQFKK